LVFLVGQVRRPYNQLPDTGAMSRQTNTGKLLKLIWKEPKLVGLTSLPSITNLHGEVQEWTQDNRTGQMLLWQKRQG
jgi:formylglycine-generating enzyme required for sulfatase activity